jgi:hypothetical protein
MAARWVGSPTTGHWVDDSGNPTSAPATTGTQTADNRTQSVPDASTQGSPAATGFYLRHPSDPNAAAYWAANPGQNPNAAGPAPGAKYGPSPAASSSGDWATQAEGELRGLGDQMFGYYTDQGAKAQGYYDPLSQFNASLPSQQPHQVENFYNAHAGDTGPTQNRGQYQDTKNFVQGQRNPLADAYGQNLGYYNAPSNIDTYGGSMMTYGTSASDSQGRYDQLAKGPTDYYSGDRLNQRLQQTAPNYLQSRYGQRQRDTAPEYTSDLLAQLGGTKSAADGLMMADPTKTQAIGDLYKNVLMPQESGPGYSENWYTSTLNGNNPYYDRLRQQTGADAERRAAATGTFNAGRSQKLQNDAISALDAQQFKDQGALAAAADTAKESRLGTLTTGAGKYEDTVLGNRKYNLDVANTMDAMTGKNNALRGDLAQAADNTRLKFGEDIDTLAGKSSDEWNKQQENIDALSKNASDEYFGNRRDMNALATNADSAELNKHKAYADYLQQQDIARRNKASDQTDAAKAVDASNQSWFTTLGNQANNASAEEQGNRDFLAKTARDASVEGRGNLNDQQQSLLADAAARAGIQLQTAGMAGGALTEAQMHAINIELQKAGMDAAEASDILHAFTGLIGGGLSFLTGGLLGGGGGKKKSASDFLGDDG